MFEVIGAVLGAVAAAVVTFVITRAMSPREGRLRGTALMTMADYPVRVGAEDGLLRLDPDAMVRVCQVLLEDDNPRAAIDLLYLAERNKAVIERAPGLADLLERVRSRYRRRFKQLVEPKAITENREHLLKQFYEITEGLGATFAGVPIEFVLHDTRDPLHSVVVIKNSITGHKRATRRRRSARRSSSPTASRNGRGRSTRTGCATPGSRDQGDHHPVGGQGSRPDRIPVHQHRHRPALPGLAGNSGSSRAGWSTPRVVAGAQVFRIDEVPTATGKRVPASRSGDGSGDTGQGRSRTLPGSSRSTLATPSRASVRRMSARRMSSARATPSCPPAISP